MTIVSSTSFGLALRRLRLAAGLSQEDLAERAGLSARGVSDLERGLRASPRPATIRMLADALGLGPEERDALLAATHPELVETAPAPAMSYGLRPDPPPDRRLPPFDLAPLPIPPTRLVERETELANWCALLREASSARSR